MKHIENIVIGKPLVSLSELLSSDIVDCPFLKAERKIFFVFFVSEFGAHKLPPILQLKSTTG